MSEPFLGQIEIFAFDYPPRNWAFCNGAILPIAQNQALFSLLGTTYGGNGVTTFGLPDLRGRLPMGDGSGGGLSPRQLGEKAGNEAVTLNVSQSVPSHTHALRGVYQSDPQGGTNTFVPDGTVVLARSVAFDGGGKQLSIEIYAQDPRDPAALTMADASIGPAGGQPHPNMMPYLTLNFCIAMYGEFPSRP